MAVFTKPGNPPKCNLSPRCRKCNSYKPVGTHHCSMCNNCILNMDHHCVWINQCVGDRNHRFFLLFLVFLWTGCFTIVCFGTNTFWNHIWPSNRSYSFCQRTSELNYLPWYQYMCADNGTFTSSCAIFGYLLAVNILILVGFLGGWNILLVSADITQLDFLQQDGLSCMTMRSKITTAIRNNPNVKETWKKFLGLNIRSRSIVTHILFPSRHISSRFDPGEIEHLLSNEQIV
uniref:Palmitoyltransferase n=1 Tax=Rhabditophanes sp. KR3021 TaxID=114890 RepID=A0AC35U562_9BILA